jgi:hypothetical protein
MSCPPATPLLAAFCDAAASATTAAALPPLPRCCCTASVALPLLLPLSCLSTHNKVNDGHSLTYDSIQQSTKNCVSMQQPTKQWINEWEFIKYYDSIQQSKQGARFFCGRMHSIKK